MTRTNKFIGLFTFALIALVMPGVASAQWGGSGGYGNGGYNRDIKSTVENLRDSAKNFEKQVDRGGSSRYSNSRGLKDLADRFTDATKDLKNAYGNGRNLNNSADEARRVLDIASQVENEIRGARADRTVLNTWRSMSYDLRAVADVYGYNGGYNNRYPNGRNNNRNGNWRNKLPFPLPF
jgi:hypothetical protein